MKQCAAKTLGVAALGAAFAAAGAGAANAAPVVHDPAQALDAVARTLPAENVSQQLPGAGEALEQGQNAVGAGLAAAQPAAAKVLADGPTGPVSGLLGGLPVNGKLATPGLVHTLPVPDVPATPGLVHTLPVPDVPATPGLVHTLPVPDVPATPGLPAPGLVHTLPVH